MEIDEDDDIDLLTTTTANLSPGNLHYNFINFSILFSLVHATVDAILSYSSSELGPQIGSYSSFILFGTYTLSSLLFAKPFLRTFSTKCGVLFGLAGLLIYVITFLISLLIPEISLVVFSIGSLIGGITAGILWTSQGSYYSLNAVKYADSVGKDEVIIKNYFSSIFASIYLSFEAIVIILATIVYWLQKNGNIQGDNWKTIIFSIYAIIAFLSVIFFQLFIRNMDSTIDLQSTKINKCCFNSCQLKKTDKWTIKDILKELSSVIIMISSSSRLRLLIPYQFMSGLSNGMVTFYVNREIVSMYVGDGYIGLLASLGIFSGAILTWAFNKISNTYSWGKYSVMMSGGFCYLYVAITLLILPNEVMGKNWIFLITYYIIHGIARAVWESTNKVRQQY